MYLHIIHNIYNYYIYIYIYGKKNFVVHFSCHSWFCAKASRKKKLSAKVFRAKKLSAGVKRELSAKKMTHRVAIFA